MLSLRLWLNVVVFPVITAALLRLRSTVIHLLMQVATMTALIKVVAFPLYNRQLMDSFTVWFLGQYEGANLLRATPPQHSATLRVLDWLDSVTSQALRHFHLLLTTTFALIEKIILFLGCPRMCAASCFIPFWETKYKTPSVSFRLRLLGIFFA